MFIRWRSAFARTWGAIIIIIILEHSIRTFVCLHCDVVLETLLPLEEGYCHHDGVVVVGGVVAKFFSTLRRAPL